MNVQKNTEEIQIERQMLGARKNSKSIAIHTRVATLHQDNIDQS